MTTGSSFYINSVVVGENPDFLQERVVFLHGLFGRGKNFTSIARGLEPEVTSLLVDLPNHGASDWTESFSYIEMADLVANHIRDSFANHQPVNLVGHSMGGKVAMALALRYPEIVKRLAVLDISPNTSEDIRGEFPHLLSSLRGLDTSTVNKRNDAHEALRKLIPSDTVRGFLLQNLIRNEGSYTWEPNLDMLHSELSQIMSFPPFTDAHFDGPTLWLGGSRSDYVTDSDEPHMRELFPNTSRVTVEGAGHWLHSEKPAEIIALLRGFFGI